MKKRKIDNDEQQILDTMIILASEAGYIDIVKLLLEKGANINASDNDGWTPLLHSCADSDVKLTKLLLEKGANKNVRDWNGISPMEHAINCDEEEIIKLLKAKRAKPKKKV